MAVGYPVDLSDADVGRVGLVRAVLAGGAGDLPHGGRAIWNERRFGLGAAPASDGAGRTIERLLGDFHGAEIVDAGDGPEPVGVPFSHLLVLTGENPETWGSAAAAVLERAIEKQFGRTIDPRVGARVRVLRGRDHDRAMSVCFGYGVFVPPAGAVPVGAVEIRLIGAADAVPIVPRLADGEPAAFYPGQRGIVFGDDEALAPATAPGVDPDHAFYLGRLPGDEIDGSDGPLALRCLPRPGTTATVAARRLGSADVGDGWDGAFRLERDGRAFADVVYAFDRRPGRLLERDPAAGALQVVGVLEPSHLLAQRPERWWIDLDAGGCLVRSALVRRAASEVFEGDRARRFDWSRHGYGPRRRVADNGTIGGRPIRVVEGRFGAVAALGGPVRLGFAAAAEVDWRLDWLDHAVTVEPRQGGAVGLASALPADLVYEIALAPGGLRIGATAGDRRVAVAPAKDGLRFEPREAPVLAPGDRAILGPLVVAWRRQGGPAP